MNLFGFMFHFYRKQSFVSENSISVSLKLNKLLRHKITALILLWSITYITKRNSLFLCNKTSGSFNITCSLKSVDFVLTREDLVGDECQIKLQFYPKALVNVH